VESILSIEEMEQQFPSEWILVVNPRTSESLKVCAGQVLAHSKDRDEVYRTAVALKPPRFAVLYTGTMPKDSAIVL
jgi:hypothetical protein